MPTSVSVNDLLINTSVKVTVIRPDGTQDREDMLFGISGLPTLHLFLPHARPDRPGLPLRLSLDHTIKHQKTPYGDVELQFNDRDEIISVSLENTNQGETETVTFVFDDATVEKINQMWFTLVRVRGMLLVEFTQDAADLLLNSMPIAPMIAAYGLRGAGATPTRYTPSTCTIGIDGHHLNIPLVAVSRTDSGTLWLNLQDGSHIRASSITSLTPNRPEPPRHLLQM